MKYQILILCTILLAGCSLGKPAADQGPALSDYGYIHSGTEGVAASFLEDFPPASLKISDDIETQIVLDLHNRGAASVKDASVFLEANPALVELSVEIKKISLEGKSALFSRGETGSLEFDAKIRKLRPEKDAEETDIRASVCYAYITEAQIDACIDTDKYRAERGSAVCSARVISLSDQGAPIALVKVEQNFIPLRQGGVQEITPQYVLTFMNVGKGLVIGPHSTDGVCARNLGWASLTQSMPFEEDASDGQIFDVIKVSGQLGGKGLICGGLYSKEVSLEDGEATVTCIASSSRAITEPSMISPLVIRAEYGYLSTITKHIKIEKI